LNIDYCDGVKVGGLCEVLQKCVNLRVLRTNAWILNKCYEMYPDLLQQLITLSLVVLRYDLLFIASLPKICKSLQYLCLCDRDYIAGFDFSAYTV